MLKPLFVSFRTTNTRYRITMKNQGKKWTIEVYYSRGIKATADTGSYGMDGLNLPWTNRIKLWTMDIRRELYWDFSMIGWMNFDFIFGKNKEAYLGFFLDLVVKGWNGVILVQKSVVFISFFENVPSKVYAVKFSWWNSKYFDVYTTFTYAEHKLIVKIIELF